MESNSKLKTKYAQEFYKFFLGGLFSFLFLIIAAPIQAEETEDSTESQVLESPSVDASTDQEESKSENQSVEEEVPLDVWIKRTPTKSKEIENLKVEDDSEKNKSVDHQAFIEEEKKVYCGRLEIYGLEKNVSVLATISGAAPMIGFLGTVIGMILSIFEIANSGGQIDIKLLADGLYTAMTTTVGGLIVGIVAYIAYNHLVVKTNKVVYQMEANSVEFLDHLNEPV